MSARSLAFDFIDGLENANSATDVTRSFVAFIGNFGFSYFTIGRITPLPCNRDRGQLWATSGSTAWLKHWRENHYRSDPTVELLRRHQHPFRWSHIRHRIERRSGKVFEDARSFGIEDGISSALRLGGGVVAAVTLGTPKYDLTVADEAPVHLASVYCEAKIAQLQLQPTSANSRLSERERECLRWVAAGKTDWEISVILGISQKTAQEHVNRSLAKLDAATRAQAVAIALMTNQISL